MPNEVPLDYPVNSLVSYHYFRKVNVGDYARGGLRLIGDSGAFSARTVGAVIKIPEFAEWCHRWRDALVWIASLDVINEPEKTWTNYRELRYGHGIDVVPTIHAGDDSHYWMDRYAGDGVDFLGLGGLVSHRNRPEATLPWLVDVFRYARDHHPTMRFHGWGVTNMRLLGALPYYSADSSNIGSSYRYARQPLFDPRTGKIEQVDIQHGKARDHHELLTRIYGLSTEDCTTSTAANRTMWVRTGVRSFQLIQAHLRRRHGVVTSPTYGVVDHLDGMHLHGVDAADHQMRRLLRPVVTA